MFPFADDSHLEDQCEKSAWIQQILHRQNFVKTAETSSLWPHLLPLNKTAAKCKVKV